VSKVRRFRVESLQDVVAGAHLSLPETEAHHARVLRLKTGECIELFDSAGRVAHATLRINGEIVAQVNSIEAPPAKRRHKVTLAVAWPKGKRAAVLVEKCSELGADCILPTRYARGVVSKDEESEGVSRLRRIAAEAAKQCGRDDVPEILGELSFEEVLARYSAGTLRVILDPRAPQNLFDFLQKEWKPGEQPLLFFIGPEGGITPDELNAADASGVRRARLAEHVLRIETAALAACAIAGGIRT